MDTDDSSEYALLELFEHFNMAIGVRANIHLGGGGGQTEFCPNGYSGVAEIFRDSYSVGEGGGYKHKFYAPDSVGGIVAELFPLTAVTYPKFVLFKHVFCFARIMSTLCLKVCIQTARIGGGSCPPPVPYAYEHGDGRRPMSHSHIRGL